MANANQVLDAARGELNKPPYEVPARSNRTTYGRWYGNDGVPWCAQFVSWVAAHSGAESVIPKHEYTPTGANWFKQRGQWGTTPRVGVIAYFDFPGGNDRIEHVGIVEAVRPNGYVITIEGNTTVGTSGSQSDGGGVYRRERNPSHIVGYGYPAYDGVIAVVSPPTTSGGSLFDANVAANSTLGVDGIFGPITISKLQKAIGASIDGKFGPGTKKTLQKALGVVQDGKIGPITVRALQNRVGSAQDGKWGPNTTRALQIALNAGKFP